MSELAPDRTEASRRVRREVVSFVRRSNRMRPTQRRAWSSTGTGCVIDVPRLDTSTSVHPDCALDLDREFGRQAPLVVEIGPGTGESLVPMARARPESNILAFEVYQPAIARLLAVPGHPAGSQRPDRGRRRGARAHPSAARALGRRAVDVLSRPLAQVPPPQAPAGPARVSSTWSPPGSSTERAGAWPRTGPATPRRCGPSLTTIPAWWPSTTMIGPPAGRVGR